jgi:hypothetical protein
MRRASEATVEPPSKKEEALSRERTRSLKVLIAGLLLMLGAVALSPAASAQSPTIENPAPDASQPDGIYTPFTNREIYQRIASDYQEIVALTDQVLTGQPLPSAEILAIYEEGKIARIGNSVRILRDFARDPARAVELPEAVAFYGSPTFLDDPVIEAILGIGSADGYSPAQRRQAIQKGLLSIIYHWSWHYMLEARESLNPGLVDEAWAIYMGLPVDGTFPNSLSATARTREDNFNRRGAVDGALREAMSRAQRAAASRDADAYGAAQREVASRFNTIFYLGTVRYLNESLRSMTQGNADAAPAQLAEGLAFYRTIQPVVAGLYPDVDAALVGYFASPPGALTAAMRDGALASLNRAADALLLEPADIVNVEML